jgi:hypothetical protein
MRLRRTPNREPRRWPTPRCARDRTIPTRGGEHYRASVFGLRPWSFALQILLEKLLRSKERSGRPKDVESCRGASKPSRPDHHRAGRPGREPLQLRPTHHGGGRVEGRGERHERGRGAELSVAKPGAQRPRIDGGRPCGGSSTPDEPRFESRTGQFAAITVDMLPSCAGKLKVYIAQRRATLISNSLRAVERIRRARRAVPVGV